MNEVLKLIQLRPGVDALSRRGWRPRQPRSHLDLDEAGDEVHLPPLPHHPRHRRHHLRHHSHR